MQTINEEINKIRKLSNIPTTINEMLSVIPTELDEPDKSIDVQILRAGIIAELDAINLYEQMASKTKNTDLQKLLLDIAKEEKTHIGEFEAMLLGLDREQKTELESGKKEMEEITN